MTAFCHYSIFFTNRIKIKQALYIVYSLTICSIFPTRDMLQSHHDLPTRHDKRYFSSNLPPKPLLSR